MQCSIYCGGLPTYGERLESLTVCVQPTDRTAATGPRNLPPGTAAVASITGLHGLPAAEQNGPSDLPPLGAQRIAPADISDFPLVRSASCDHQCCLACTPCIWPDPDPTIYRTPPAWQSKWNSCRR